MNIADRIAYPIFRMVDGIFACVELLYRGIDHLYRGIDRFYLLLDRLAGEAETPDSIIPLEILERLAGMRVLLVGGHPDAPLAEINEALTDAGLHVCWERHDMHLIPKNSDLIPLRPEQLLVNNTNKFDVVIVDWRKPPSYEWGWCPSSIFMKKFAKGALRIGIGPADKRDFQLSAGANMFLDYDEFLVPDIEPLLVALATVSIVEKEFANR